MPHSNPEEEEQETTAGWRHAGDLSEFRPLATQALISQRDVYHIAFLLRQRLVPDLVPAILHLAGCHRHLIARNLKSVTVEANMVPLTYLITTPIRVPARARHAKGSVLSVRFTITSHDQGRLDGRAPGNWTWLTAAVLRAGERMTRGREDAEDVSPRAMDACRLSKRDITPCEQAEVDEHERVATVDATQRDYSRLCNEVEVVRNVVGKADYTEHTVEWGSEGGSAEQRRWVQDLEDGDRILVRAWARHRDWRNYVSAAEVVITTRMLVA